MRILIAEDDVTSRALLAAVLKKNGHEVVEAANGADAWEQIQKPGAPKLIILDWVMPVMDGLEVVHRVRSQQTEISIYIIMLTSRDQKNDIITGLDAGADDYLTKPFHPGELRARIEVGRRLLEMQAELLKVRNILAREATHDPLTGIFNRRAIETALSSEMSRERRSHNGLAVGICDIDYFKNVNDTCGHLVGDEVLCGFARRLETCLRSYDKLGRFGGEEFLVIASGVNADVNNLFERLCRAVADNPISTTAGNVSITISIGVKIMQENESMDQLLTAADAALYQAKREGRNRVCMDNGKSVKG